MQNYKDDEFNRFLEELKYKCDIVSIVSQYVPLTKKSGKYFGCCPFHNEKTGSFCVNTDGQYYHCFGCGASGNVINFIMEMESLSFMDAVRFLAERASIPMPEFRRDASFEKKKENRDILKQLMKDAAVYYRNNLLKDEDGKAAREYLEARGIDDEASRRYGLGLSLGYDGLQAYMRRKGYSVQNLKDCGLVSGERLGDAFANRIIVPILNNMSEVIAFGGRIYRGEEGVAKYKNSTNTVLFDKSRSIYGINFVKREKRAGLLKDIILVEGYMDVISLGAAGIRNAVAGMGTALTDGQAQELKRLVPAVYVCYDGDTAGRKAAIKNVEPLVKCGLDVKVVSLADGCDPDDTVRGEGAAGFMKRISEALPVIDYKLKLAAEAYDLGSVNGRAKYVAAAMRVLKDISGEAEREVYMRAVAEKSGVSIDTLRRDAATGKSAAAEQEPEAAAVERAAKNTRAARFVLSRMLAGAEYAKECSTRREWFEVKEHADIYDYITGGGSVTDIFQALEGNKEINAVLDVNLGFQSELRERGYFIDCLNSLANEFLTKRLNEVRESYKDMSSPEEKRAAIMDMQTLQRKLKSDDINDKL